MSKTEGVLAFCVGEYEGEGDGVMAPDRAESKKCKKLLKKY